jgi:hypothetical protein
VSTTRGLFLDPKTGIPAWAETYFAAAIDASKGERWSSESPFDDPRRRRTQGPRLEKAGRHLGVVMILEAIAATASPPRQMLSAGAAAGCGSSLARLRLSMLSA